jgi:hypothetical protein
VGDHHDPSLKLQFAVFSLYPIFTASARSRYSCGEEDKGIMVNTHPHPYYPLDVQINDYAPNHITVPGLLFTASLGASVILGATFMLSIWAQPNLRKADRIAILWFVLCMIPTTIS